MNELDPGAKALFDVAREALDPPADAEARIFSKLGVAAGVSVATLAATTSAASKPATLVAKLSSVVLQLLPTAHALPIAVVAFSGTAVGVWSYTHTEPAAHVAGAASAMTAHAGKRAPRPALAHASLAAVPEVASAAPTAPGTAAAAVSSAFGLVPSAPQHIVAVREPVAMGEPSVRAPRSVGAEPAPRAAPRDAQAAAEILLIREMQAAWRGGNDAQLSAAIAEHRARFPHGMLSEEREALSAMLGCRTSPAQASVIRAEFAERFALSPYEGRISAACLAKTKGER